MRNVDHQALQTLDVSGNQRHAVFSATVPTKLVGRHGYSFVPASNNYTTTALNGAFNTSEISLAFEFDPAFAAAVSGNTYAFCDSTNGARYIIYQDPATANLVIAFNSAFLAPTIPLATYAPYWRRGCRNVLMVSGKTGKSNAWLNEGRIMTDNATAWAAGDPATLWLGSDFAVGSRFPGNITRFASWPQALTMIQVYDLMALWQKTASEV
jgi:hypothetical protein